MRFGLVSLAALLVVVLAAPYAGASERVPGAAAAKAKGGRCKSGQVQVKFPGRTGCMPIGKALPKPKPIDLRLAHLQEVLKFDPATAARGKKRKRVHTLQSGFGAAGKRAQKKLLSVLPKALAFIDRKGGGGHSSRRMVRRAVASAACQPGAAGPTSQLGGATVGLLGDNGAYIDASVGGGLRVRVSFASCGGVNNFHLPECPTANGSVDGQGSGEFRATIEVWDGGRLVSRNSSTFEEKAKVHGEVGPDARLKFIEVEHTEEVFIVASGGIVIRGGVSRKVRIDMPGAQYDPAAAAVRFFGDSISNDSGAAAFASTADGAIRAYRSVEPRWSTFNPGGPYCAEPVFSPESNTLKLKKGDAKQFGVYAKARADGGRASQARWTLAGAENADFSPTSSQDPAPAISYTVTNAPKGGQVRVTVKFTSTAGVGEKTWTQETDQDSINTITGTFSQRIDFFGSIFESTGNATFERWTPPIFGGADGGYKLLSGDYTFTASGKASQIVTDKCSMKGTGHFALQAGSEFTVLNLTHPGEPPFEYSFGVASGGLPELPMVEIEIFNCSPEASEQEGKIYSYPAVFSLVTPTVYVSPDGIAYDGSFEHEEAGGGVTETWHFEGKP